MRVCVSVELSIGVCASVCPSLLLVVTAAVSALISNCLILVEFTEGGEEVKCLLFPFFLSLCPLSKSEVKKLIWGSNLLCNYKYLEKTSSIEPMASWVNCLSTNCLRTARQAVLCSLEAIGIDFVIVTWWIKTTMYIHCLSCLNHGSIINCSVFS